MAIKLLQNKLSIDCGHSVHCRYARVLCQKEGVSKLPALLREKIPGDTGAKQYSMVIDSLFNEVRVATDDEMRMKPRELSGWRFCGPRPNYISRVAIQSKRSLPIPRY